MKQCANTQILYNNDGREKATQFLVCVTCGKQQKIHERFLRQRARNCTLSPYRNSKFSAKFEVPFL